MKKFLILNLFISYCTGQMTSMWIPTRQLACGCPTIKPGESYLVLDELENGGKSSTSNRRSSSIAVKEGLILDKKTLVIEWRRDWRRRMKRYRAAQMGSPKGTIGILFHFNSLLFLRLLRVFLNPKSLRSPC